MELTATEYELLRVLAQDAGRVLTHETLPCRVWAGRPDADPKAVRAYVKRLRDKLADKARPPGPDPQRARGRLPHGPARRPVAPRPRPRPAGRADVGLACLRPCVTPGTPHACVAGML